MGKARRGSKRHVAVETFDSDDERTYGKEKVPDPSQSSYYIDEIDEFHMHNEKMLLDKGATLYQSKASSDPEEVLRLDDDDDDEDNDEAIALYEERLRKMRPQAAPEKSSDVEDDSDDNLDTKAWGNQKSKFYGSDNVDKKKKKKGTAKRKGDSSDSDFDEVEALNSVADKTQRRLDGLLTEDDYGVNLLKAMSVPSEQKDGDEKIVRDLSTLSKKEMEQIVRKESPELLPIIDDYIEKLKELKEVLIPLLECYKKGCIRSSKEMAYLKTKTSLYLDYCTNVSFYLMLKYKKSPVHNHPVIERILMYRKMCLRLNELDGAARSLMTELLRKLQAGELVAVVRDVDVDSDLEEYFKDTKKVKKRVTIDGDADEDEEMEEEREDGDEHNENSRREIDYTIEKNKGLRPRRKKEFRNPRVKHRIKYRKALINRRGMIREVRKELKPYGGEASGIRAGVKKSIKLKV